MKWHVSLFVSSCVQAGWRRRLGGSETRWPPTRNTNRTLLYPRVWPMTCCWSSPRYGAFGWWVVLPAALLLPPSFHHCSVGERSWTECLVLLLISTVTLGKAAQMRDRHSIHNISLFSLSSFLDFQRAKDCKTKEYGQWAFRFITPAHWTALPGTSERLT